MPRKSSGLTSSMPLLVSLAGRSLVSEAGTDAPFSSFADVEGTVSVGGVAKVPVGAVELDTPALFSVDAGGVCVGSAADVAAASVDIAIFKRRVVGRVT